MKINELASDFKEGIGLVLSGIVTGVVFIATIFTLVQFFGILPTILILTTIWIVGFAVMIGNDKRKIRELTEAYESSRTSTWDK